MNSTVTKEILKLVHFLLTLSEPRYVKGGVMYIQPYTNTYYNGSSFSVIKLNTLINKQYEEKLKI